jgi:hypothetical protein
MHRVKCDLDSIVNNSKLFPYSNLTEFYFMKVNITFKVKPTSPLSPFTNLKIHSTNPQHKSKNGPCRSATNVTIYMTSADYLMLKLTSDIIKFDILEAIRYNCKCDSCMAKFFKDNYFDKNYGKIVGDLALEDFAKLCNNSATGKYGQKKDGDYGETLVCEDGILKTVVADVVRAKHFDDEDLTNFVPIIASITALQRLRIVYISSLIGTNNFIYTDTDSIKIINNAHTKDVMKDIVNTVDKKNGDLSYEYLTSDLGWFGKEYEATTFVCYGSKKYGYIDKYTNEEHLVIAGMNSKAYKKYFINDYKEFADAFISGRLQLAKNGRRTTVRHNEGNFWIEIGHVSDFNPNDITDNIDIDNCINDERWL